MCGFTAAEEDGTPQEIIESMRSLMTILPTADLSEQAFEKAEADADDREADGGSAADEEGGPSDSPGTASPTTPARKMLQFPATPGTHMTPKRLSMTTDASSITAQPAAAQAPPPAAPKPSASSPHHLSSTN